MTIDLYDSHYGHLESEVQRQVRKETYGDDLGQTSWITLEEYQRFLGWLDLDSTSHVLELACGSGGITVRIAQDSGAQVVGIDVNDHAIVAARARTTGLAVTAQFEVADASQRLPFEAGSYDAIFCNDAINHLPDREAVLREWHRLLRPGGRLLYTDPIVVTRWLSNAEIAARSSIGFFLFVAQGENERLLTEVGFEVARSEDVTESVAEVSARWRAARERRRDVLVELEGEAEFGGVQGFLEVVHRLSSTRRLSRYAYLSRKQE